ncbi:MAG: bi-domain-containing oxidoreductase [Caldilineaceae bacterium]|nr:bi-domain-containing oxidoreductase [Caldilineaceae bacterium]
MKQILQALSDGTTEVAEVPAPRVRAGHLLVRNASSVISAGTERMLLEFGKANWLDKARQQPDKVRQVLDKMRTDGIGPTLAAVRAKLDKPIPLGYSSAGVVVEVGAGVEGFVPGDRVVSNGPHAEYVCVPVNLCARIPPAVSDEAASFTVLGAIALQGVRLTAPTLGEAVVVVGLGLIGQLTVQLLRANGCRVLGIDFDAARAELAAGSGAEAVCVPSRGEDPLQAAAVFSDSRGVDAVIITAATRSSEPMHQAATMCRKRGRIVLVGVTGLELSRADFYEKELSFQVSCSYGPGRYDPAYEEQGHDYPFGLVRWTEQRNFEAVLGLLASGQLDVACLVTERVPLADAERAYISLAGANPLAVVLQYPADDGAASAAPAVPQRLVAVGGIEAAGADTAAPGISVIGTGNYANQVLIPAIVATPARRRLLVSAGGVSAVHAAKRQGFAAAATDPEAALEDPQTRAVVIATRHDSHAALLAAAVARGKHVFVEKPLAITGAQLDSVVAAVDSSVAQGFAPIITVGFNRRFAPQVVKIKALLAGLNEPRSFVMTVNAGAIPPEHWTQDEAVGGGRIIGEGCHFVDLLRFLAASPIRRTHAVRMGMAPGIVVRDDKAIITLEFEDGSIGVIHYLANGHRSVSKERLEVFCAGRILQLDNFRRLTGFGWPGFSRMNLWRQDKGNAACMAAFVEAVRTGSPSPIPFGELVEVTRATFDAVETMHSVS